MSHVGQVNTQQFVSAWASLHPAQQALIAQDRYTACAAQLNTGVNVSAITVASTHRTSIEIPGTRLRGDSVVITFNATVQSPTGTQSYSENWDEFYVNGSWRWIVTDPSVYTRACD
jgi:hypothetical protein